MTREAEAETIARLEATTVVEDDAAKSKVKVDAKAIEYEEKRLNQIVKEGLAFTTVGGHGLFCVGE